jgi:hypothetical protein
VTSFSIWLPAGWSRVDLESPADEAIETTARALVRAAPPSRQPSVRRLVEESLVPTLHTLADSGAVCVILPLDLHDPDPVKPVIAMRPFAVPDGIEPLDLVQAIALGDETAEARDVPGLVALRRTAEGDSTVRFVEAYAEARAHAADLPPVPSVPVTDDGTGIRLHTLRVSYLLGEPDTDRWMDLELALDYPNASGGVARRDQVVELFDAMVTTFRWVS